VTLGHIVRFLVLCVCVCVCVCVLRLGFRWSRFGFSLAFRLWVSYWSEVTNICLSLCSARRHIRISESPGASILFQTKSLRRGLVRICACGDVRLCAPIAKGVTFQVGGGAVGMLVSRD